MKRWLLLLLIMPMLLALSFAAWTLTGPKAMPEAEAALASDSLMEVDTEGWLVFRPTGQEPEIGLIFYPGGRVDPSAYAPIARDIAAQGHLVVVVPMPLNPAFLAPNRATEIIEAFPEISRWVIGGHSMGGAMATNFVDSHPTPVQGMVLWAAYPSQANDLSGSNSQSKSCRKEGMR